MKQSHSAEKPKRGDPLDFLKLHFAAKCQNTGKETLWRQKKPTKKSRTVPKNSNGDLIVSSDNASHVKNGVIEREDPLH